MKVLVYGSANIDYSYKVDHICQVNETVSSISMERHVGGKGANQATAIAKSGSEVYFAGRIGRDGIDIGNSLEQAGADTRFLHVTEGMTGTAVIQIDRNGENTILLYSGENCQQDREDIEVTISSFDAGDILLIQNEIDQLDYIIRLAHERGMIVIFNLAPFHSNLLELPLEMVDVFIVNEVEGAGLAGVEDPTDRKELVKKLDEIRGNSTVILTVGKHGSYLIDDSGVIHQEAMGMEVVDTTAAGDTFIGYYIAARMRAYDNRKSLYYASKASGITISRPGAAISIPTGDEVFGDQEE